MAFQLAGQGKSDRAIAVELNASGYRTTGTHGARPFSKDTVRNMLSNKFYIGYIPDGNGGWLRAKHESLINQELFNMVQEQTIQRRRKRDTINTGARIFSLSSLMRCCKCGSTIRIQRNPKGDPRVYCAGRAQGQKCDSKGTFLKVYEDQIRWYLEQFIIPNDYQEKLLDAHRKLQSAYADTEKQRAILKAKLERIGERYDWGHISKEKYLAEYGDIQNELSRLTPVDDKAETINTLARFLANIADAWDVANQEQRNKLAKMLFEEIRIEIE